MNRSECLGLLAGGLLLLSPALLPAADTDPTRILEPGKLPADGRIGYVKNLNKDYFPMTVPGSKEAWEIRRKELREQVLVATGLWPMPEKTPLEPVIHGKIDKGDYTVEKVFFASMPGHYVSGNLYRPKGKTGKLPAVLTPHGHWANGRLHDAGEAAAREQIKAGAEQTMEGGRYLLQAIPASLARLGCIVFAYDMVGVADSKPIPHAAGFADVEGELRLQSAMGLQTWNSIRALDFVTSLPDVDPARIGVTGASGGGTQTFILCAIDDRPAVAFPAVMVSTGMQGGCVCENCSCLRVNAGNIDLAALFAPKPLGMTGAKDWTIEIEHKGLPELQQVWKLYGAEDLVMAKCFPQFGHNYNQVSREVMYNWFNKHLHLGANDPVKEKPFEPILPKELSVYDEQHPQPKDAAGAEELRRKMAAASDKQVDALRPTDEKSLAEFKRVIGTALRVMVNDKLPAAAEVESVVTDNQNRDGVNWRKLFLSRKGQKEQIPAVLLRGKEFDGTVVVWVHPAGKASLWQDGKLNPAAKRLLDAKQAILAADVFLTGEYGDAKPTEVDAKYAGYTFGYNRTLLANRIHDVLTAVAFARGQEGTKPVNMVGWDKAGPWAGIARGLCGDAVAKTAIDVDGFRFDKVFTLSDEMMLPGAVKYGGLPAFMALAAPAPLYLHAHHATGNGHWVKAAYDASGKPDRLGRSSEKASTDTVVDWLLRS
jgi:dienelactone hydrolase